MGNKSLMPMAGQDLPRLSGLWEVPPQAFERWVPGLRAAAPSAAADTTISILDAIGFDPWTGEGVTAKRISAALRSIGAEKDVQVNINSPGGDLFEGMAIYNILREHQGKVTVKVLGLAASAASIIVMAGDEIQIARAGFLMVHNTWVVAIGNRHDMRETADMLEPFDFAMADIYAARTGIDQKAVQKKMDAETWINGSAAVDEGWADELLPADAVAQDKRAKSTRAAAYQLDTFLAKQGVPRSERRALLNEYKAGTRDAAAESGTPRATEDGTPSAADAGEYMKFLESFSIPEISQ